MFALFALWNWRTFLTNSKFFQNLKSVFNNEALKLKFSPLIGFYNFQYDRGVIVSYIPSKESIAFSAQLECILDAFLSPPKRFGLTEISHGTSALRGDRFNNRFSKRWELSQSNITNYSKLPVLLVIHF
jgi:hypothetical protein